MANENGGSAAIVALEQEIAAIEKAQEPTQQKIRELQAQLIEGANIIARNRAAIDILNGKTPVSSQAPSRARRGARAPQASSEEREHAITAALAQNASDGLNGTELAEAMGVSPATARKTLDGMVTAGTIKKTGERRGTKYFPA